MSTDNNLHNLKRENTEVRNQPQDMVIEGTCDNIATVQEITEFCNLLGYNIGLVNIFYDEMFGFYRWDADILENKF